MAVLTFVKKGGGPEKTSIRYGYVRYYEGGALRFSFGHENGCLVNYS